MQSSIKTKGYIVYPHAGKNSLASGFLSLPGLVIGLFLPGLLSFSAYAGGNEFSLVEVSPGNYLHQGRHADIDAEERDDIANIGFIVGDYCVAVIDTGGSLKTGDKLLEGIRNTTDKPVCYVINTHVHFDHVLGNAVFNSGDAHFFGHEQLPDAIAANREFFLEEFSKELGPDATAERIIAPGKTVMETHTIDLGNRPLLLSAWPKSHTHTDLTVLDQKTGTLWAGDLVFRERVPVLDGSLKGWLNSLEALGKMDIKYTIPGHGPSGSGWEEVASAQTRYLNVLLEETRQAVADGLFIEDAKQTVGQGEKDQWLLFEENHPRNVQKAFVELEWE